MDSGVHMTGPVVTWQNPVVIPHHCLCVCQSHRVIKKDDINVVLLLQSLRMESKDFWILFPHRLHHGQMSAVVTGNSSFSDTVSFRDRCCAISLGSVYKAAGTRWRQGRETVQHHREISNTAAAVTEGRPQTVIFSAHLQLWYLVLPRAELS